MKKRILIVLLLVIILMVSCSSQKTIINTDRFIAEFQNADLNISNVIYHTEATDPNEMLGRPDGYVQKVNFTFSGNAEVEDCTIEIYDNVKDAKARYDYLENVFEQLPAMKQYIFIKSGYVLRFDYAVIPAEAEIFEYMFNALIN